MEPRICFGAVCWISVWWLWAVGSMSTTLFVLTLRSCKWLDCFSQRIYSVADTLNFVTLVLLYDFMSVSSSAMHLILLSSVVYVSSAVKRC